MSARLDELKREAAKLSDAERAELALVLVESLETPSDDADVERSWQAEIERRAAELERGQVKPVPGDDVFARVRRDLGWSLTRSIPRPKQSSLPHRSSLRRADEDWVRRSSTPSSARWRLFASIQTLAHRSVGRVGVSSCGGSPIQSCTRQSERVLILAVTHHRQRPGYWRDRSSFLDEDLRRVAEPVGGGMMRHRYVSAPGIRRPVGSNRAAAAKGALEAEGRSTPYPRPGCSRRHRLRLAYGHAVASVAPGTGLRERLLAATPRPGGSRRLGAATRHAVELARRCGGHRLVARECGQHQRRGQAGRRPDRSVPD